MIGTGARLTLELQLKVPPPVQRNVLNYELDQTLGQAKNLSRSKSKHPEDCLLSFIDQLSDGFYSSSKLVRNKPKNTRDKHFIVRTFKTEVRSYRRNKTHRSIALYRNKKDGSTRDNIAYVLGSFLELDGSTDGTIKTRRDVLTLARKNNLLEGLQTIETSKGHFHLMWTYNNPLPWTEKMESYWTAQQKRLIELLKQAGFNVDVGASLNPTQNLRNPSQLNPYNFKRRCEVFIHKSYQKTSLRAIYRALNGTNIPNPKKVKASTVLRRYLRQNKYFSLTYDEWAEVLGVSRRTAITGVLKAIDNGDLAKPIRTGNNKREKRRTHYTSLIFIEPEQPFSGVQASIFKTNYSANEWIYSDFCKNGAEEGYRNKTLFTLGVHLNLKNGGDLSFEELKNMLEEGRKKSCTPEKEFERTLKSALKSQYTQRLSIAKMKQWGLAPEKISHPASEPRGYLN